VRGHVQQVRHRLHGEEPRGGPRADPSYRRGLHLLQRRPVGLKLGDISFRIVQRASGGNAASLESQLRRKGRYVDALKIAAAVLGEGPERDTMIVKTKGTAAYVDIPYVGSARREGTGRPRVD